MLCQAQYNNQSILLLKFFNNKLWDSRVFTRPKHLKYIREHFDFTGLHTNKIADAHSKCLLLHKTVVSRSKPEPLLEVICFWSHWRKFQSAQIHWRSIKCFFKATRICHFLHLGPHSFHKCRTPSPCIDRPFSREDEAKKHQCLPVVPTWWWISLALVGWPLGQKAWITRGPWAKLWIWN